MYCHKISRELPTHIAVTLLNETEYIYEIQKRLTGTELMTELRRQLYLLDVSFFGIKYSTASGEMVWINPNGNLLEEMFCAPRECRTMSQASVIPRKKNGVWNACKSEVKDVADRTILAYVVSFGIRFYPIDPTQIKDENTRYQLFLQLRSDLMKGRLVVDCAAFIVLCGLILQSDVGDYGEKQLGVSYVRRYLKLSHLSDDMESKIKAYHIKCRGTQPTSAEYQFLKLVKCYESYGVKQLKVHNGATMSKWILRIGPSEFKAKGPNLYAIELEWANVVKVKRRGKELILKFTKRSNQLDKYRFILATKVLCENTKYLCREYIRLSKAATDSGDLSTQFGRSSYRTSHSQSTYVSSSPALSNYYNIDDISTLTIRSDPIVGFLPPSSLNGGEGLIKEKCLHSPNKLCKSVNRLKFDACDNEENPTLRCTPLRQHSQSVDSRSIGTQTPTGHELPTFGGLTDGNTITPTPCLSVETGMEQHVCCSSCYQSPRVPTKCEAMIKSTHCCYLTETLSFTNENVRPCFPASSSSDNYPILQSARRASGQNVNYSTVMPAIQNNDRAPGGERKPFAAPVGSWHRMSLRFPPSVQVSSTNRSKPLVLYFSPQSPATGTFSNHTLLNSVE